jgi:hypothetical protein
MTFTSTICMKRLARVALILNLGVAGIYAQQRPVRMTFSGTSGASAIKLGPSTTINTSEDNFDGSGTLGLFTFRNINGENTAPQPSNTCSPGNAPPRFFFLRVAGAGVFRFLDGSMLNVSLMQGEDCIDLVAGQAHCTMIFKITGGTGRFKNATGMLTLTETVLPALADVSGSPVFFAATGDITGAISGPAINDDRRDEQQ